MFKILVAEDDAELRQLFCKVLTKNGYISIPAADGQEALDVLDREYVDLIVSDIMMPKIDGFEFAETVRRLNANIPILFLSARDDLSAKEKGFRLGIDDYMVKPVELAELEMRVRAPLRRANIAESKKLMVGD